MRYEQMKEKERELKAKVKALFEAAKSEDACEDQKYGVSRRGDESPEELQRTKSWLAKRTISPQSSSAGNEGKEADVEGAREVHRCGEPHPEEQRPGGGR